MADYQPYLTPGKALYFSHGFAITWNDRTGVVPPKDIDVIMVAPKGSGTSLRTMFLEGRGLTHHMPSIRMLRVRLLTRRLHWVSASVRDICSRQLSSVKPLPT